MCACGEKERSCSFHGKSPAQVIRWCLSKIPSIIHLDLMLLWKGKVAIMLKGVMMKCWLIVTFWEYIASELPYFIFQKITVPLSTIKSGNDFWILYVFLLSYYMLMCLSLRQLRAFIMAGKAVWIVLKMTTQGQHGQMVPLTDFQSEMKFLFTSHPNF